MDNGAGSAPVGAAHRGCSDPDTFVPFPKIARLSREVIVTEKIDGTNAQIFVVDNTVTPDERVECPSIEPMIALGGDVSLFVGSRTRWITPEQDNYGFAAWVSNNADALAMLGPGRHFGEWWGKGIQRNYSQTEKRFSLFNVSRWGDAAARPECCDVVPTLHAGPFEEHGVMRGIKAALNRLQTEGSAAAPGFMRPEGIVVFHAHGNILFKKTFEKDDSGKDRGA